MKKEEVFRVQVTHSKGRRCLLSGKRIVLFAVYHLGRKEEELLIQQPGHIQKFFVAEVNQFVRFDICPFSDMGFDNIGDG